RDPALVDARPGVQGAQQTDTPDDVARDCYRGAPAHGSADALPARAGSRTSPRELARAYPRNAVGEHPREVRPGLLDRGPASLGSPALEHLRHLTRIARELQAEDARAAGGAHLPLPPGHRPTAEQ